jgi:glycosidase
VENRLDPRNEFRRGDFFSLKDLRVQEGEPFVSDPDAERVLEALIKIYQYWIALTDCDGFRVDTVKHVSFEASRNFCGAIHEYAESIGKENFLPNLNTTFRELVDLKKELAKFMPAWHYALGGRGAF